MPSHILARQSSTGIAVPAAGEFLAGGGHDDGVQDVRGGVGARQTGSAPGVHGGFAGRERRSCA